MWHGYRKLERDGNQPAFPFGYGLSYTKYHYANLTLDKKQLGASDILKASLEVTNIGDYPGDEIVQLYVSAIGSAVERATKELKAFQRISLKPGETRTVPFEVPISKLAYYDETQAEFVVESIEYEIFIGTHSLDENALKNRFTVYGD